MFLFRFLGRFLIFLSVLFAGIGLYVWLTGQATTRLGQVWFQTHAHSLNYAEVIVARHLSLPDFWQNAILPYLLLPAWEAVLWAIIVLLISGGILRALGLRRRRRRVA